MKKEKETKIYSNAANVDVNLIPQSDIEVSAEIFYNILKREYEKHGEAIFNREKSTGGGT